MQELSPPRPLAARGKLGPLCFPQAPVLLRGQGVAIEMGHVAEGGRMDGFRKSYA